MPKLNNATPKYCKHKATGQAIVTIAGRDHYLGPHGTKASRLEYDRLIGEWLASGRPNRQTSLHNDITVIELCRAYWKFAKPYYSKNGEMTSNVYHVKDCLRYLRRNYGHTQAEEFGPLALKALRAQMIEAGLARTYINENVSWIRRIFRWAASEELVSVTVHQSLMTVTGLRKGKSEARETDPVLPVADDVVEQTLTKLPGVVAAMVRFQRLTGCRPGEVCMLRPCDVETSGDVWAYRPESHKTEHHGRQRVIFIGPKAQEALRPYLLRDKAAYCFSPMDSERKRRDQQHEARATPLSCGNRPGSNRKRKPRRTAGTKYTVDSYRRAIHRSCKRLGIRCWSPNQLRHAAATEIRREFGLEAAQVTLGHASADVTQVHAERDLRQAEAVALQVG